MELSLPITNEESRVVYYAGSEEPTTPSNVTPATPLDSLNLNWRERDLPERERTKHVHRLHPYLGKFIPQLVEVFLRKYFLPGQWVLDPFVGSGTALVQANELGINAIGFDISAFNTLLSRAKTNFYNHSKMEHEVLDILDQTQKLIQPQTHQLTLWDGDNNPFDGRYITNYLEKWFAPQALRELCIYRDLIGNYEYQDLLKIILSRSARSARLTTHFDLDFPKKPQTQPYWCYKHSKTCSPTTSALQFLKRYSTDTIKRIEQFAALRTNAQVIVRHEDSRAVQTQPIDGVITSPPYVGLIDYHEQHRYAYELLNLEDRSGAEIGAASNGSSQKAQREYQEAIADVFKSCCQRMPIGGRLIIIASDKYNLYNDIASSLSVEIETTLNRHVNRRTGRRSNEFYESVFIWRKI